MKGKNGIGPGETPIPTSKSTPSYLAEGIRLETGHYLTYEDISEAAARLPKLEVQKVLDLTAEAEGEDDYVKMAHLVLMNRLQNPICNQCLDTSATEKLVLCKRCNATWYCGEVCRTKDAPQHSHWCCTPDAKPDTGPLAVVVVKISKGKQ